MYGADSIIQVGSDSLLLCSFIKKYFYVLNIYKFVTINTFNYIKKLSNFFCSAFPLLAETKFCCSLRELKMYFRSKID